MLLCFQVLPCSHTVNTKAPGLFLSFFSSKSVDTQVKAPVHLQVPSPQTSEASVPLPVLLLGQLVCLRPAPKIPSLPPQALRIISRTLTASTSITRKWMFPEPGSFREDSDAMSPTGDLSVCALLLLEPGTKLESGILPHLPISHYHSGCVTRRVSPPYLRLSTSQTIASS